MKKLILAGSLIAVLSCGIFSPAMAVPLISNGDFTNGLASWNTSGDMTIGNGSPFGGIPGSGITDNYALFGNNSSSQTDTLSQSFLLFGINSVQVSFDWAFDTRDSSLLSNDTFAGFYSAYALILPITIDEMFSVNSGEQNGIRYGHYSQLYDVSWLEINGAVSFRLNETDGFFGDRTESSAAIDNVMVDGNPSPSPVPEPMTILLLGSGLAVLWGVQRKKK
jgi:hypothetical protein